ncbi:hypothetical protein M2408_002111 [Sphingobacterium sp. BIGb0165]|nr:hypothetical protein [Sphingobacterium sp. BIGb0165]
MLITNGYGCFLSDLMFFKLRRLLRILSIHSKILSADKLLL